MIEKETEKNGNHFEGPAQGLGGGVAVVRVGQQRLGQRRGAGGEGRQNQHARLVDAARHELLGRGVAGVVARRRRQQHVGVAVQRRQLRLQRLDAISQLLTDDDP